MAIARLARPSRAALASADWRRRELQAAGAVGVSCRPRERTSVRGKRTGRRGAVRVRLSCSPRAPVSR
jgi:hypothetical protein